MFTQLEMGTRLAPPVESDSARQALAAVGPGGGVDETRFAGV